MKTLLKYVFIAFILQMGTKSYGQLTACDSVTGNPPLSGTAFICKYSSVNVVGYNCDGAHWDDQYSWINLSNPGTPIITSTFSTQDTGRWELTLTNPTLGLSHKDTVHLRFQNFVIDGNAAVKTKCEYNNITLTASTGANIVNYEWFMDGDPMVLSTTNTLDITTVPGFGSAYYIATADLIPTGCKLIDTIYVSTFATPQPFLGNDTGICDGQSVILNPSNLCGGTCSWQYSWNGGALGPPSTYTVNTTETVAILVKGPFPNPCTGTDTITVTVNSIPTVNAGTDTTLCQGASKQMGESPQAGHNYSWLPISGLSDAAISNPVFSTTTLTGPNTYWVTITNPLTLCSSNDNAVITVNPTPIANAGSDGTICAGDSANIGVAGVGGVTYLWTPSTGLSNANISNPKASPADTTVYALTASYGTGCLRRDTAVVAVNLNPIVNAGANTTICFGENILLNAAVSGPPGPYTFAWSPGTNLDDPSSQSPLASTTVTTPFSVLVTVQATGCNSTGLRTITVNPLVTAQVAFSDSTVCPGETIQLQGSASGGTGPFSYAWTPNTNIANANTATPNVNPVNSITYTLIVTDAENCSDDTIVSLDILWVDLGSADTSAMEGDSIFLDALNSGNDEFVFDWYDGTGTYIGTATYLWVTTSGKYTISVINPVTLCEVRDTIEVTIIREVVQKIYIPNAFNPNMPDGNNSNLRVYGNNVSNQNFMFRVYSKWGDLIYEASSFDEANLNGWNGNFQNSGQPMNMGVYTYTVIGEFFDGTTFEQSGTTNLLR